MKSVLGALRERLDEAERCYRATQERNGTGLTSEQRAQADVGAAVALALWRRAEAAYRRAVEQAALAEIEGRA